MISFTDVTTSISCTSTGGITRISDHVATFVNPSNYGKTYAIWDKYSVEQYGVQYVVLTGHKFTAGYGSDEDVVDIFSDVYTYKFFFTDIVTGKQVSHDVSSGYLDMGGSLALSMVCLIEDPSSFLFNDFTASCVAILHDDQSTFDEEW
jgi:hypothetical protein